jgi:DNA-binding transcriptional regulator LsrR (DeoR family)
VGKISRVSKQDFNRVLGQTRMLAANQQIAYAVLVDGKTQAEVAEATGQSRSNIQRIVEQARGYVELSMADDGSTWVRVDVDMPKSLVEAWAVLSGELMKCKAPKVSQAIIGRVLNAIDHGTKTLKATKRG